MCIETLQYVKKIQAEAGGKAAVIDEEEARLELNKIILPIDNEDDFKKVESLLINSTFRDALVSISIYGITPFPQLLLFSEKFIVPKNWKQ